VALFAGASTRDITPEGLVFLVGYPHVPRMSTGVHDRLTVSTLALRSGPGSCVIASLDLLFISPALANLIRATVGSRLGIAPEAVFVGCTHTHSGPACNEVLAWRDDPVVRPPDPAYLERLVGEILLSAQEAVSRLEPAELACTSARVVGVGSNRLDPSGPSDPDAGVLLVRGPSTHRSIALVVTYAMHPTVLHEDSTLVSADFPGAARRELSSRLGGDPAIVYLSGTAGNQSPRHTARANTYSEAERLGTLLARSVLEAVRGMAADAYSADAPVSASLGSAELPRRRFSSPGEAWVQLQACRSRFDSLRAKGAPRGEVRTAECAVYGAEETVTLAEAQASGELETWMRGYSPATTQLLGIGEIRLVGLPGELYVEYGLDLKQRAPPHTLVASLVNGDLQGYIVTPEAVRQGTYEALLSVFEPEAGKLLVDAALELMAP
jgi:hypothetical protein